MFVLPDKESASALVKQGVQYAREERFHKAVALFRRAIEIDPYCEGGYRNLVLALRDFGKIEESGEAAAEGLANDPDDAVLHTVLAESLRHQGRGGEAMQHAERAVSLNPHDDGMRANLALLYTDRGDRDRARVMAQLAIEMNPLNAKAHDLLAHAQTYSDPDCAHITQMLQILSSGQRLEVPVRAAFCFALAKAFDDVGDYGRAFAHYKEGNNLIRSLIKYSSETVAHNFRQYAEAANVRIQDVTAGQEEGEPVPVFIVGMPRSGTTLVEQILSSHPAVYGGGELAALNNIQFQECNFRPARYLDHFRSLGEREISAMRVSYLEALKRNAPDDVRFITDKMPLNFRFIPLIRILFPQAKIVHCRRDPRDTCFSIYRVHFGAHLPFAYDLEELTGYYAAYEELMAHFESVYGDAICTVQYEDLVGNTEAQIRRLLDCCGLDWNDACCEYYKNDRAVVTASNYQVKQPIYRSSIGHWKRYKEFLKTYPFFNIGY